MALLYINFVHSDQSAFTQKVNEVAAKLGIDPNWLMQVMYSESGVNPKAVNQTSGATGLIQFMPSTARGLGTTTTALYNMDAVEQLNWVYKYFLPWSGKMKSYYDVYACVFFPAVIGKPDSWVLQTSSLPASLIARQNPAVNLNKDGQITVGEFKQYVKNTVLSKNWTYIFNNPLLGSSAMLAVAAVATFFFKK